MENKDITNAVKLFMTTVDFIIILTCVIIMQLVEVELRYKQQYFPSRFCHTLFQMIQYLAEHDYVIFSLLFNCHQCIS